MELRQIQKTIDTTIRTLGGYWTPLSGLARVLEELGELGELILNEDFSEEFTTELSDVFAITTCVSNQYCANLSFISQEDLETLISKDLKDIYLTLVMDCGELSRILNSYEGNKKLKPTENPVTVEIQASKIVSDILVIAQKMDIDLMKAVEDTMLKVRKRDIGRFETLYDPSLAPSRDEFILKHQIVEKVWGLRDSTGVSIYEDLIENTNTIERFLKISQFEGLDIMVLRLPKEDYDSSLKGIPSQFLDRVMVEIKGDFLVISNKKTDK